MKWEYQLLSASPPNPDLRTSSDFQKAGDELAEKLTCLGAEGWVVGPVITVMGSPFFLLKRAINPQERRQSSYSLVGLYRWSSDRHQEVERELLGRLNECGLSGWEPGPIVHLLGAQYLVMMRPSEEVVG